MTLPCGPPTPGPKKGSIADGTKCGPFTLLANDETGLRHEVAGLGRGSGREKMKRNKPVSLESTMRTETAKPKIDPKVARDIQARIGQQLREMYDDVVKQGVPDRF